MKHLLKSAIPYGIAILLFYAFTAIYFAPSSEGKTIQSSDISSYQSTSSEIANYRNSDSEKPTQILWTNSAFSGLPTYMISPPNYMNKVISLPFLIIKIFHISRPYYSLLIGLLGIFFLLVTLGVNPWLSIVGAFAYNLASFHYILIAHGHNAKAIVVSLFAYVIIGMVLLFKHKKYFWGTLLFTFALVWQITASHIQMTYYLLFISIAYYITQAIVLYKEKAFKELIKISTLLGIGVIVALSTNTGKMWTEYEYAKNTMRGGREIPKASNDDTDATKAGLSNEYILAYSYDFGEALSGIMPQAKGLYKPLPENSSLYKALVKSGNGKIAKNFNKEGRYYYWGHQTASAAPFYYGVVVFILFILALFIVKGHLKYWLASIALLTFILTIGKNSSGEYSGIFYGIQNFFIKYVPLYDKFRDVKNIVTVQSLAMVILAFIGLSKLFYGKLSPQEIKKALKNTAFVIGGLFLIIAAFPTILGDTASVRDAYMFKGWPENLLSAMQDTRAEAIRSDAFRALLYGIATLGLLLLFAMKKMKANYAIVGLMAIITIDMLPQDLKALNHDSFVSRKQEASFVKENKADEIILKDQSPHYRVYKFGDSFNDAFTSKYHKSIGGYSAAKLSRYQDMIEYHFSPFVQGVSKASNNDRGQALFSNNAINMLNTKYFIINPDGNPIRNPNAYGNAWLAHNYIISDGALDEITKLKSIQSKETIVIDKAFTNKISAKEFAKDPTATVSLASYHPNTMVYDFKSASEQMVVFSEIYYAPNGWQAYLDGKKVNHFRANYILRAMVVPAGEHQITFKFEPKSYFIGTKISLTSSYLLILALIGGVLWELWGLWKSGKAKQFFKSIQKK